MRGVRIQSRIDGKIVNDFLEVVCLKNGCEIGWLDNTDYFYSMKMWEEVPTEPEWEDVNLTKTHFGKDSSTFRTLYDDATGDGLATPNHLYYRLVLDPGWIKVEELERFYNDSKSTDHLMFALLKHAQLNQQTVLKIERKRV